MVLPDSTTIDWIGEFIEVSPDRVFTITDSPADRVRAEIVVDSAAGRASDGDRERRRGCGQCPRTSSSS